MKYRVIGPEKTEGTYDTLAAAAAAAESLFGQGALLEWSNPEPGRHELWYLHRDEGLKTDTHYRIVEDR